MLESYPLHEIWSWVFPIPTYDAPNRRIAKLTTKWLQLNADNEQLFPKAIPILTPSSDVTAATFDWILRGGARSRHIHAALQHVMYSATRNSQISSSSIEYCRKWLKG
jgi:hypothetical protein